MITQLTVAVGQKVTRGEKLLSLEAMKMLTQVNAAIEGTVKEIAVAVGETVEAKDLLVRVE